MQKDNSLKLLPLLLIVLGVTARLLPHPANVAPIAAIALFGGRYLPRQYGLIIPIIAMLISDYFIGFYGATMFYVYGAFALTGLIGWWLKSQKTVGAVLVSSLGASVLFYLITNFGVWMDPLSGYAPGVSGLIASLTAGLPFFRNTLLGDLGYTVVLFGSYELIKRFATHKMPEKIRNWAI